MTEDKPTAATPIPLSRFRATLARPRGKKRMDALLSATDAEAAVQELSVPELYFLIKDVGLVDSYDIVALAHADQIQGCLDLDVWERDEFQLEAVYPWLEALMAGGFETLGRVWAGLDPEFSSLILQRSAIIYDHTLNEGPEDDDEGQFLSTLDSFFTLKFTGSDEDAAFCLRLIDDLYRWDMGAARHTIMSARSEPKAALEEMAYRWRSGRMADLGYLDFYDALEIFRPIDPRSVKIGEDTADRSPTLDQQATGELPVPMVEKIVGRAFLARALSVITDAAEARRLEAALLVLVNRVLSAARVNPADEEAISIGTEHATATLALGLETVSQGSLENAVRALSSIALGRLHRVGHTMTLRLSRIARTLRKHATVVGDPSGDVLAILSGPRPFFPCVLDDPPAEGVRPFETQSDLRVAAEHLSELTLRIAVADCLDVDLEALAELPEPRPDMDDYPRTAVLRAAAGGTFDAAPVSDDEVRCFLRDAIKGGAVTDEARERAAREMAGALRSRDVTGASKGLTALLGRWIGELEAELGGLAADAVLDHRFIKSIILRASKA